jgi:peptidyl-prolyl cis-trans isomerase B (cyclophilin B)
LPLHLKNEKEFSESHLGVSLSASRCFCQPNKKGEKAMRKVCITIAFLLLLNNLTQVVRNLSLLSIKIGQDKLYAAEKQKDQLPTDWKDLPPELQQFFLDLGRKELTPQKNVSIDTLNWLQLVDAGKYKDACTKIYHYMLAIDDNELKECIDELEETRKNLGGRISRIPLSIKFGRSQSDIVITYDTAFEKKKVRESINNIWPGGIWSIESYRLISLDGSFLDVVPRLDRPQVAFITSEGNIIVELFSSRAPRTVDNFLSYVDKRFYDATLFHRVLRQFIIQGGGYTFDIVKKRAGPKIRNEADNGLKNKRGTIAMARNPKDPHSATSQFFINIGNNKHLNFKSATPQGWGYAVFGQVIEGMDVVDAISKVQTENVFDGRRNLRNFPKAKMAIMWARRFK